MAQRSRAFISYSHSDKKYLKRLQVHLAPYSRGREIEYWDDTRLEAGSEWEREIMDALDSARVAVFLVSADFLASPFITEKELPRLIEAAHTDGVVLVSVVLSPCAFAMSDLAAVQMAHDPARPLSKMSYHEREAIWEHVAEVVARALSEAVAREARRAKSGPTQSQHTTAATNVSRSGALESMTSATGGDHSATSAPTADTPPMAAGSAGTIVVADDESYIPETIKELIGDEFPSFSVLTATGGKEALKLIHQHTPVLLITDLYMPDINGARIVEILAEEAVTFPIVLMSTSPDGGGRFSYRLVEELNKLLPGQIHFLHKPFDLDVFYSLLRRLVP